MARFVRLDRMELIGFKSFYGRTRFDFPAGITAVVGPNGCGKSNIGDAISWVLGEQRASALRSDRMENVIFSGSEGRRPLGMAEVSLHFKNIGIGPRSEGSGNGSNGGVPAGSANPGGNGDGSIGAATPGASDGHGEDVEDSGTDRVVQSGPLAIPAVTEATPSPLGEDTGTAETPQPSDGTERPGTRFFLEDLPEDVVVTRRLYRSGESEYSLNGRRCRLKDVQDLLALTEIGSRLYTSIEQGKVDQILTSKPKERRTIIEEAAGILGYKVRRRQAEQKLEAARANLLRISDITSEVEKQINSLKRQASRARRYRQLSETLRQRRSVITHRRFLALETDRRSVIAGITALREKETVAATDLSRVEAELESLRSRIEEGEEGSRTRRDGIHALDVEIDRIKERQRSSGEQLRDLAARIESAGDEVDAMRSGLGERRDRIAGLDSERSGEQGRVAEAEERLGGIEEQRRQRAGEIEAHESGLERTRVDLVTHFDRMANFERQRAAIDEQVRGLRGSLEQRHHEIDEASRSGETLSAEVARLEQEVARLTASVDECVGARDRCRSEEGAANEHLAAEERRLEEMKGRTSAIHERIELLRTLERQHEGYGRGVAEILGGGAGVETAGVVGGRIQVPPGLERAVAAALGHLLEAILVPGAADAIGGVRHLRRSAAGRAAFVMGDGEAAGPATPGLTGVIHAPGLPDRHTGREGVLGPLAERVQGYDQGGPVATVLTRTMLVKTLEHAIDLHRDHPEFAYVTPEGDLIGPDGVVVGGEGPELHHGILARRAELADLRRQAESFESERGQAEPTLDALRRELDNRRSALESAAEEAREAERHLIEIDLELRQRRDRFAEIEAATPHLLAMQEGDSRDLDALSAPSLSIMATIAAAEVRRRELEEGIRDDSERLSARRSDLERVLQEESDCRSLVAAGRQKLEAMERERRTVEAGLDEARERAERLASEREEWAARVDALKEQDGVLGKLLEGKLTARAEAAARDEASLAGLSYDRSLLHAREGTAREGRTAREELRNRIQEKELQMTRLDSDRDHMTAGCQEELAISIEALCADPPGIDEGRTLEEYEKELGEVRAALEKMGPVNLMAIEQFTELEERFSFLSAQKKDLEDSMASLRETIRKINRESRERFLKAYEVIQAGFQDCFSTLFGGGRAELRLQDDEDALEAGIEIAAQPPGKRLQTIALLSGGERALTVVALLFALFRFKPSPFCVLDEVDAPLDEANIVRFTQLLQDMRRETQFILITHNRKSMEAADLLYGVTMEEPGISKVLPLHFE